jgi:rubredoxin
MVWECQACSYVFDCRKGDAVSGIPASAEFRDLPENWKCPVCGVGTEFFEEVSPAGD